MATEELELEALEHLYERRNHELKAIRVLVKQKSEESKRYFELCGESPSFQQLEAVLTTKLSETESSFIELRKKVLELRKQKERLVESKNQTANLSQSIDIHSKTVQNIKNEIKHTADEVDNHQIGLNKKLEELKQKQNDYNQIKAKEEEVQKKLDDAKNDYNSKSEGYKNMKQQKANLALGISTTRDQINEAKNIVIPTKLSSIQLEIEKIQTRIDDLSQYSNNQSKISDVDDLDPVYKDQIDFITKKIESLKNNIQDLEKIQSEATNDHKIKMSELRLELQKLRQRNNLTRNSIEEVESSLPQALSPLTRELSMWRQKVDNASKIASESEHKINQQRTLAENELFEVEKQEKSLQDEIIRTEVYVNQLKSENDQKSEELEKYKQKYEETQQLRQKLEDDYNQYEKIINESSTKKKVYEDQITEAINEQKEKETNLQLELRILIQKVEDTEKQVSMLPSVDFNTNHMTETEINMEISNLQSELMRKKEEILEIRHQYEESMKLRLKFEAALSLLAELQDEEEARKEELEMVRNQFNATLRSLEMA